jgi:EPS-associated MarR family transcriptional regulator
LRYLHEKPEISQRELSARLGVSLGFIYYCLKALMDRGLVKIQNFDRNSNKFGYSYFLTPAGIAENKVINCAISQTKKA